MAYGFDVDRLLVWLAVRDPHGDGLRAGSLCKRHADAMVVPRGWTLDDRRDAVPRLFKTPAGERVGRPRGALRRPSVPADGPAEQLPLETAGHGSASDDDSRTVAAVTGEPSADDDPDATVAIPWMPEFDEHDDLDGVLAARSPLLARAFRGTDRPR
ncbi:MAG: hypothetical protein ABW328_07350 [Ilumatobacteraceae bacterium]